MSHTGTSHVTQKNESYHMYEWFMSHIGMGHMTHMNESWSKAISILSQQCNKDTKSQYLYQLMSLPTHSYMHVTYIHTYNQSALDFFRPSAVFWARVDRQIRNKGEQKKIQSRTGRNSQKSVRYSSDNIKGL